MKLFILTTEAWISWITAIMRYSCNLWNITIQGHLTPGPDQNHSQAHPQNPQPATQSWRHQMTKYGACVTSAYYCEFKPVENRFKRHKSILSENNYKLR